MIQDQYPGNLTELRSILQLNWSNAGFRLAWHSPLCCYVVWSPLAVSWFTAWLITERHCSWVEQKSTVCNLPQWAKRKGYWFIGKTLLVAWSSLCSKWLLRSWTNIIIKAAMRWAASWSESSIRNAACIKASNQGAIWTSANGL